MFGWFKRKKKKKRDFYLPRNRTKVSERHHSPSKQFYLVVEHYKTTKGGWDYTKGCIYTYYGRLVAEVKRNYSSFPFCWFVSRHEEEFLMCGEDYQGQSVVFPKTGAVVHHRPVAADKGGGFCWAVIEQESPTTLRVEGCYWGGPYEIVRYNVPVDPMCLPYTEISREDCPVDDDDADNEDDEEDEDYETVGDATSDSTR